MNDSSHDSADHINTIEEIDLASVDHVLRTTRSVRRRIDFERPL
jgi:hypothetical protein